MDYRAKEAGHGVDWDAFRKKWSRSIVNSEANVTVWNEMAASFQKHAAPEWDSDPFLREVARRVHFEKGMRTLDIGCGTGMYSIRMAERAEEAVGVDVSANMIAFAEANRQEAGRDHVKFLCMDWPNAGEEEIENLGTFDVVFAKMTPAVSDGESFIRLLRAAKKHCFFVKPTRRTDSVLDRLKAAVGARSGESSFDQSIPSVFEVLWQMGMRPEFSYREDCWESERPLDEAKRWYGNKLLTYRPIGAEETAVISRILEAAAIDGMVREKTHTTVTTLYWNMEEAD